MNKPKQLREHIELAIAQLKRNPDKLLMFIENGSVRCHLGENINFKYTYNLKLIVIDYAMHIDTLMVPILAWLKVHQQDLLDGGDRLQFEAEAIDHEKTDIAITLPLSEKVQLLFHDDGNFTATHPDCPPIENAVGPTPWELDANGELFT